jgi:hypothetical protein
MPKSATEKTAALFSISGPTIYYSAFSKIVDMFSGSKTSFKKKTIQYPMISKIIDIE